ncbi:hypothetical protein AB0I91_10725 [Actinosynnema sp. NPDC049800]
MPRLLGTTDNGDQRITRSNRVSLHHLLVLSRRMRKPVPQIITWPRELGAHIPDLSTMIREALIRVPREVTSSQDEFDVGGSV